MKFVTSNLKIINFAISYCTFELCPPSNEIDRDKLFERAKLNIDYDILQKLDSNSFAIIVSIKCNNGLKEYQGYKFLIKGYGLFELIGEDYKKEIDNFLLLSALPMLISNIRAFIMNISSNFPLGKYCLPSLDLTALLNSKQKEVKEKE